MAASEPVIWIENRGTYVLEQNRILHMLEQNQIPLGMQCFTGDPILIEIM